ncbi:hypothetical protein GQ457_06G020260 [Hibiscus cannabinus]
MALEITEILIEKLNLLCRKETEFSGSKSQVPKQIEELKEFKKFLKGAEDHESSAHTIEDWEKLIRDIYSLEDIIEPLISRTTLKPPEIFVLKWRFNNKIGKLRRRVRQWLPNDAQSEPATSSTKPEDDDLQLAPTSSEVGTGIGPISQDNDVHKEFTFFDADMQQVPTSSVAGTGIRTISEEDGTTAKVTDLEGPPRIKRTDSIGAKPPPRRLLSRNWSAGEFLLDDVDEDAAIPTASDEAWGETGEYLEEKSAAVVLEGLVNKLAQPILSSSKLQCLLLQADVSSSGKAILLWTVYNAEIVKQRFHFRAWINVSGMSGETQIVKAILEQCNYDKEEDPEALRSPQQRLHDFLIWKRFLIVLYGVQESILWDDLEPIFPYSLNGSRVILADPGSKSFGKALDELPQQQLVKSSAYLEEDSSIASARAVIHELTESILSPRRLSFLISVVGVVGSGKTTLLWAMYIAEDIQLHFQCCAWVHVPELFNARDLLTDIWEQVTGVKTEILMPIKSLQQNLRSFLAHKRYLVVLYDVWTAEIWEYIKSSLPNSLNGSRVVLAVQEVDVARKTNSWIFKITSEMDLLHNLKDMQENASEQKHVKRWERLTDIKHEASVIFGLEDKIHELAELVLNNYRLHFLVSVLGVAGSGKTTVVKTFYKSIASRQHFECRAWISVPQDFDEKHMLLDLVRQLRKVKENHNLSVEQLRKGLSLFLTRKRYLIVLDDVRTPDIWNRLNPVFPNSSNGSRVILTTRNTYLAYHMNPPAVVLPLRPLDEDESWTLFTDTVRSKEQTSIDDIPSDLKVAILQRCRGLPLTIVVLGGLLSTKKKDQNYKEWFEVMGQTNRREKKKGKGKLNSLDQVDVLDSKEKHEKNEVLMAHQMGSSNGKDRHSIEDGSSSLAQQAPSYTIREDDEEKLEHTTTGEEAHSKVMTNIATSADDQSTSSDELISPVEISLSNTVSVTYQHLSFQSKCCLLYLGMFPRMHKIPVRRLLQLWLAEGLVGEQEKAKIFDELLRTNMIEIEKRSLDGSPKTCKVMNTLYDTLLLNAGKVGFFYSHSSSGSSLPAQSNIRRLADHSGMYIDSGPPENSIHNLRSYISFYKRKGDAPTHGVSELLNKLVKGGFGMLVVLDLEGVYKPVLHETLGRLRQLKYLGLRQTLLDSIPESVGGLPHLETLDIKQTYIITLPSAIWEAKKLQHLYMSEIYADVSIQKTAVCGALSNLQTLWGLIIRRKIPKRDWLDNLTGLRKLKLTCLATSMEVLADWLSTLTNLESLKLRSISHSNEPAPLALGEVKKLKNLSKLYLLGHLPKSFQVSELPENLEVLTLSVSHLSEDPMEALGELKKLRVLRLHARSFRGKGMTCRSKGFPMLQVLKLWMLEELEKWTVEGESMPNLKELEIRCCKKLEVHGFENLTNLKKLTLTNMEPPFVADAEKRIGDQVKIIKNVWKFSPPWE